MSDSPRLPGTSTIVTLVAVAASALIAATTLATVALSADEPDRCCPATGDASPAEPSPATKTMSTRPAAGLPLCLVGTWRSVDEVHMIKFYTDADAQRFVATSGRLYEFRPDGTGVERQENFTLVAPFKGNQLKIVGNGTIDFTWKAGDGQITYMATTKSTVVYSYYDQRGLLNSLPHAAKPDLNEVDAYTCQGTQMSEGNPATGYHSAWSRTNGSGVYG